MPTRFPEVTGRQITHCLHSYSLSKDTRN